MGTSEQKHTCGRCRKPSEHMTVSVFTSDCICLDCAGDEEGASGYLQALEMRRQAEERGDTSFAGIGFSSADLRHVTVHRLRRQLRTLLDRCVHEEQFSARDSLIVQLRLALADGSGTCWTRSQNACK